MPSVQLGLTSPAASYTRRGRRCRCYLDLWCDEARVELTSREDNLLGDDLRVEESFSGVFVVFANFFDHVDLGGDEPFLDEPSVLYVWGNTDQFVLGGLQLLLQAGDG